MQVHAEHEAQRRAHERELSLLKTEVSLILSTANMLAPRLTGRNVRVRLRKLRRTFSCQATARAEVVKTLQQANAQQHKVCSSSTPLLVLYALVLFTCLQTSCHPPWDFWNSLDPPPVDAPHITPQTVSPQSLKDEHQAAAAQMAKVIATEAQVP